MARQLGARSPHPALELGHQRRHVLAAEDEALFRRQAVDAYPSAEHRLVMLSG